MPAAPCGLADLWPGLLTEAISMFECKPRSAARHEPSALFLRLSEGLSARLLDVSMTSQEFQGVKPSRGRLFDVREELQAVCTMDY
jgi:hypothetical protein